MKHISCLIVIPVFLFSCHNKESRNNKENHGMDNLDSVSVINEYEIKKPIINYCDSVSFSEHISVDIANNIAPITKNWLKYYGLKINDFQYNGCGNFELDKMYSHPIDSSDMDLKTDPKRFVYSYSPDKKKYIDIYYYTHYDEERNSIVFSGEVDQLMWLYDMENKMGYIIQSWGTVGAGEDVIWLDNDKFVLLQRASEDLSIIDIFDIRRKVKVSYVSRLEEKESYRSYYVQNAKRKGILEIY